MVQKPPQSETSPGKGPFGFRWNRRALQVALLVVLTVAAYSNTHDVPFTFDDLEALSLNPSVWA